MEEKKILSAEELENVTGGAGVLINSIDAVTTVKFCPACGKKVYLSGESENKDGIYCVCKWRRQ